MSDEAERAWEKWAHAAVLAEVALDRVGLTWTHVAFLAGFEAGAEGYAEYAEKREEEP